MKSYVVVFALVSVGSIEMVKADYTYTVEPEIQSVSRLLDIREGNCQNKCWDVRLKIRGIHPFAVEGEWRNADDAIIYTSYERYDNGEETLLDLCEPQKAGTFERAVADIATLALFPDNMAHNCLIYGNGPYRIYQEIGTVDLVMKSKLPCGNNTLILDLFDWDKLSRHENQGTSFNINVPISDSSPCEKTSVEESSE